MATITKRKSGWYVQVRRKGYEAQCKTLRTKADALAWARKQESLIDLGMKPKSEKALRETSLSDLFDRYLREVTPKKRSAESEACRMEKMRRSPLCALNISDLSPAAIAAYRDNRLLQVKPSTVRREICLIRQVVEVARKEWGLPLASNPVSMVTRPQAYDARDRRLEHGDLIRLETALTVVRNPLLRPIILLAIETALRRGELLSLTWASIDLSSRTAHIPTTKTGIPRTIPLTDAALNILSSIAKADDTVFPIQANTLRLAWERVRNRAGLKDLRFHDLRHEALSRFAEMGLTLPELSVISGHKDPKMLFRYTHLRPSDLARKLEGWSWSAKFG